MDWGGGRVQESGSLARAFPRRGTAILGSFEATFATRRCGWRYARFLSGASRYKNDPEPDADTEETALAWERVFIVFAGVPTWDRVDQSQLEGVDSYEAVWCALCACGDDCGGDDKTAQSLGEAAAGALQSSVNAAAGDRCGSHTAMLNAEERALVKEAKALAAIEAELEEEWFQKQEQAKTQRAVAGGGGVMTVAAGGDGGLGGITAAASGAAAEPHDGEIPMGS